MHHTDPQRLRWIGLGFLRLVMIGLLAGSAGAGGFFDGERAMDLIRQQCALGPRVPGTPPHQAGRAWLRQQLEELGLTVWEQPFPVRLPLTGQQVDGVNVWGLPSADGPSSPALMLSAHWDTRPYADRDPQGGRPPMAGANDGASGVAVALEVARALQGSEPASRLVLVFWDAEDAGINRDLDSWALGARYGAAHPPAWIDRVALGINLDMVGGTDMQLRQEVNSLRSAPQAVAAIWSLGGLLAPKYFEAGDPVEITDDHLPWIEAGVPYLDLIGWPYEHWHTRHDTPEHCSPAALQAAGAVTLEYIRSASWAAHGRPTGELQAIGH